MVCLPCQTLCREAQLAQDTHKTENASFVFRLWLETNYEGVTQWRWKAYHVQSGEERYFDNMVEVLDFVAWRAKSDPPQLPAIEFD
jgi:hypothetical protein|tara:strand:+ start:190 stop:447 length:258 start_codon:yes stop_codon:yes gene_type:complete